MRHPYAWLYHFIPLVPTAVPLTLTRESSNESNWGGTGTFTSEGITFTERIGTLDVLSNGPALSGSMSY